MTKLNKFTLTLLSTMILTACSSGGSSGNSQPEKSLPNNNAPKVQVVTTKPTTTTPSNAKVENQEKVKTGSTSEPKTEQPKTKPTEPKVEPTPEKPNDKIDNPLTNTAIFDSFNRNGGSFESGEWISLQLDENQNIQVLPLHEKMIFSSKEAEAFWDNSGQLLGYLGYASFSHTKPNINNPDDEIVTHYSFPMLEMDQSQKMRPNNDINYQGSFYYAYNDRMVTTLKGDVTATYRAEDKRLFLELFGQNNEHWELKENPHKQGVNVAENGGIFGQVYDKTTRNATFDGGIYGKNGEVLAGKLTYDDHSSTENNSWKGVLGAKAQ